MSVRLAKLMPAYGAGIVMYVNAVNGNNSNSGMTPSEAKLTIDNARTALEALGGVGTIRVHAPSSNPAAGFVTFSSGAIILEGMDSGSTWYAERVTNFTSGWSDDGDGVYHRAHGSADADILFVPTQIDDDGFGRMLLKNTSTPTTPGEGQFGRDGTNFYVHLVDDANPNSHTIKRHNTGFLFRASSTARLTIRNCVARYTGGNGIFECNGAAAALVLENCVGQYSGSAGVSIPSGGGTVFCSNCTMQRHANDGYNQHGGTLTLVNCDASYNNDEGASNHDGTTMTINGGRYHHNQAGGCTVVNSGSKMYLVNVLVDFNGAKNGEGIEKNGIVFDTGTSGSITDCTASNNVGSGFYCNNATVEIDGLTSGTEQGNTLADVTC